jgi:hypothetical protein
MECYCYVTVDPATAALQNRTKIKVHYYTVYTYMLVL